MSIHIPIMRNLVRRAFSTVITDERRSYKGIHLLLGSAHVASLVTRRSKAPVVATMFPATGAFPICALGVWAAGRVVLPLNFFLAKEELEFVIEDSGVDMILTAKPMIDLLGWTPKVKNLVFVEDINFKGIPKPRWPKSAPQESLAALLYSGGTTGMPKGVQLTHANIQANIEQVGRSFNFHKGETILGVLPQFHVFGFTCLTWMPLSLGMKVVYLARFQPLKLLREMRRHRPNFFVGIPSMYNALLKTKEATAEDFKSFRALVSGGEPLPRALADAFKERFGIEINEGYGLTETSPVTHVNRGDLCRAGSVGKAVERVRTRICDIEQGGEVPVGAEGEIRLQGPNVFSGYYNKPEESANAFDEEGYFRTGDIGKLDEDGYLWITGRLKEMLIVAGENVFPREIEEVLNAHPMIQASGVIGTPSDTRGELPVAFVELDPSADPAEFDQSAIKRYCRERLASYKTPRSIRVVKELPRSPAGKILRRQLKPLLASSGPDAEDLTDEQSHAISND